MYKIETIQCNMLAENCYIISDETNECVIVDCGAYGDNERTYIERYIEENNLKPVHHILTHGHFDHVLGAAWLYEKYGLKPTIAEKDDSTYNNIFSDLSKFNVKPNGALPPIGRYVKDGDTITFGHHTLRVMETPGHSRGSVVYYCEEEKIAFTGDTLFKNSIGRTDFPGGSMFQIIQSLRMITQLPDDTKVYPGHGASTTIGYELATNPYLDR